MKHYDAIIIGGGIVGITSAFFLMKEGKNILVVDRQPLAKGTTNNSFAWINASSKASMGDYHRLNAKGVEGYNKLSQEFGETSLGLNPCGQLSLAPTADAMRHSALRDRWQLLQKEDYPCTWINDKDLRQLEPSLILDGEYEALFNYGELCLDAPRFTKFLAARIRENGGEILEGCEVTSLDIDDSGKVLGVIAESESIKAEQVLLAAGPDTGDLLAQLTGFAGYANRFPLTKSPGILLTTPDLSPKKLTRRIIYWDTDPDLHILPHFSGGWRIGADDTDGLISNNLSEESIKNAGRKLLERARKRLSGIPENLDVEDCRLSIGIRPVPEDGRSIADVLPGTGNFFIIATHSGVTLSPALGEMMASFMCSGKRPDTLTPYTLERFPGFN